MKKLVVATATMGLGLTYLTVAAPASAASQPERPGQGNVSWAPCKDDSLKGLECADIKVPLNYKKPKGKKITLALSRVKRTGEDAKYQGVLLVNPGGPGGEGRSYAGRVAKSMSPELKAAYDVIGFDPRGVGASTPISCQPGYFKPVGNDYVPSSRKEEKAHLKKARGFAKACQKKHGQQLKHMRTIDSVRDMNSIRKALGQKKINYYGASYGTYLGGVFATKYPKKVRRMVLDSVVRPSGVWYSANVDQNRAFDRSAKDHFAWIAKHDSTYKLGKTGKAVEKTFYKTKAKLKKNPLDGKVGTNELTDTFLVGGYAAFLWPDLAAALSDYVSKGDGKALSAAYDNFGATTDDNGYAVYNGVQCTDTKWPKWKQQRQDTKRVHRTSPFMTWSNTWYNAPCLYWGEKPGTPVNIKSKKGLPKVLLFQATKDAATPYPGALEMQNRLKGSRLVVEKGGRTHGVVKRGNACIDDKFTAFLSDGSLPGKPTVTCDRLPDPEPAGTTAKRQPADPSILGRR